MRLRYTKREKLNHNGIQYRQGDILEVESLGQLPENWFEVLDKEQEEEETEIVEEKPKKKGKAKKETKKEEVIDYGYEESTNEDMGS